MKANWKYIFSQKGIFFYLNLPIIICIIEYYRTFTASFE